MRSIHTLTGARLADLRALLPPEQPGPLVAHHVLLTGHGGCRVDRWPDPHAAVVWTADNYTLLGDPQALQPSDLRERITGFVEVPERFEPPLRRARTDLVEWPRVIFQLDEPARRPLPRGDYLLRRLGPSDAEGLAELSEENRWVSKTWCGPAGLAASGIAWAAVVSGRPVSVACPFFVTPMYEDLGVVTEPDYRGRGMSVACTEAVCRDVRGRGRTPTWATTPDNQASLRVAEKLGFRAVRQDRLFVVGIIPRSLPGARARERSGQGR